MTTEILAPAVIIGMGIVTYLTRAGGVWAMGFVPITPRVESFLRHLASSVLVGIVVGGAARGDAVANLALVASIVAMVITRRIYVALPVGMGAAAATRAVLGL